jgi:hypothetical protein
MFEMEENIFWNKYDFSSNIIIYAWLGAVICFFPTMLALNPQESTEGCRKIFEDAAVHEFELSVFIITIPLFVDLVLDIMFSKISWQVANARFTIMFSIGGTYLFQYLVTLETLSLSFNLKVLIFVNNTYARQILLFCGILSYILTHSPIIMKAKIGALLVSNLIIINICFRSITVFTSSSADFNIVITFTSVIYSFSVIVVNTCIIIWGIFKRRKTTSPEALMIISCLCVSSNLVSKLIGTFVYNSTIPTKLSIHAYYVFMISDMTTVVIICIIPDRLVRYKVVVTEVT